TRSEHGWAKAESTKRPPRQHIRAIKRRKRRTDVVLGRRQLRSARRVESDRGEARDWQDAYRLSWRGSLSIVQTWPQTAQRTNQWRTRICSENGSPRVSTFRHFGQGRALMVMSCPMSTKKSGRMTASLSFAL